MNRLDRLSSLVSRFEIQTRIVEDWRIANLQIFGNENSIDTLKLYLQPEFVISEHRTPIAYLQIDRLYMSKHGSYAEQQPIAPEGQA